MIYAVYDCVRRTSNVALEIDTRERLKALGRKGQTYDEIILELLTQSGRDGKLLEIKEKDSASGANHKPKSVQSPEVMRHNHGTTQRR